MSYLTYKPYQKYLSITLLGFASGLPYMLIFSTLATWLADINVDIKTIGFFAWVVLTYSLKDFRSRGTVASSECFNLKDTHKREP